MTERLLATLERLPPRVRRSTVAVGALLALGAVIAALTLTTQRSGHKRQPPRRPPAAASSPQAVPRRLPRPVSKAALLHARQVAERFLAGYLPFAYGQTSGLAISDVTPALRSQLLGERAQATPVERRRRPRVVSLQMVGTTPAFVVATAIIGDGGVAAYRLRFTLRGGGGRWTVSSVEVG